MTFRAFPRFDETTAPADAREALANAKLKFGAVPEPLARYASSPSTLKTALAGLHTFESSSLAPVERETLAMTMARRNGCNLCLNLHRRILNTQKAPAELVSALEGEGYVTLPARGAYFVSIDLHASRIAMSDEQFARHAIEHGVATIPFSAYYASPGAPSLVRLCFAKKDDTLDRGAEALAKARRVLL